MRVAIPAPLRLSAGLVAAGALLSSLANAFVLYALLEWERELLPAYLTYLESTIEPTSASAGIPVVTWPAWINVVIAVFTAVTGFATTVAIDGALIWCVGLRKTWARPLIVLLDAANVATVALLVPFALVLSDRVERFLDAPPQTGLEFGPLTIVLLAGYAAALIAEVVVLFRPAVRDYLATSQRPRQPT